MIKDPSLFIFNHLLTKTDIESYKPRMMNKKRRDAFPFFA